MFYFNPRTHEGCDYDPNNQYDTEYFISIHAPTRGATLPQKGDVVIFKNFNPRTHEGCDLRPVLSIAAARLFQSTHPRGVRHRMDTPITRAEHISIHAPTRGATCIIPQTSVRLNISIHAPTRGATIKDAVVIAFCANISIHAPTRGATREQSREMCRVLYFNPRTHEGCDIR